MCFSAPPCSGFRQFGLVTTSSSSGNNWKISHSSRDTIFGHQYLHNFTLPLQQKFRNHYPVANEGRST